MIFVLAVCVLAPCSMVYLLGAGAAALLPALALVLGVTLGLGVRPGALSLADDICSAPRWWCGGRGAKLWGRDGLAAGLPSGIVCRRCCSLAPGPPESTAAAALTLVPPLAVTLAGSLVAAYFGLLLYMNCWVKVEAFFEATPWLRCAPAAPLLVAPGCPGCPQLSVLARPSGRRPS